MRHRRAGIVNPRISQPALQPLRLHFAANARQFGANIAADHVPGRILHRMARGAEGFSVEAGAGRWIGGELSARDWHDVSRHGVLLAIRNAEMSRASSSLNLKFGIVAADRIGLRIFQPRVNPLARGLVGDVRKRRRIVGRLRACCRRAVSPYGSARNRSERAGCVPDSVRSSGQRTAMALPAGRLDVFGRKNRLLPGERAVVRFGYGSRSALPAMAHGAAELIELVRNHRMSAEGLGSNIGKAGFLQSDVATGAAVDDSKFRQPDLLNPCLEVPSAACWPRCGCESSSDNRADSDATR